MAEIRVVRTVAATGALVLLATLSTAARAPRQAPSPQPAAVASQSAVLKQYCVTCHNSRAKVGGLVLDTLDVAKVGDHADVWEKVVRKLRGGVMPPVGSPRPDKAGYETLTAWFEGELDKASAANPNPGRRDTFHRMNRAEYRNAVRDLLDLDVDVETLLPSDDGSYGFDNMAGVLRLSQSVMERYLAAAHKIGRAAVAPPATPVAEMFKLSPEMSQNDRAEGLPFGTRGGALLHYNFPQDGEY